MENQNWCSRISKIAIGNEIRSFLEQSSVRGVSRAARKSLSKVLRGIWIIAIVASISITVWQLDKIIVKYMEYKSGTMMREALHKSVFPWVTVCNESPPTDGTFVYNWTQFAKNVEAMTKVFELVSASSLFMEKQITFLPSTMTKETAKTFLSWYGSLPGFVANLPLPTSPPDDSSSNGQMPFIVDCKYFDWQLNPFTDDIINCRETVRIIYDFNYYHCYSFRVPAEDLANKIRGLNVIFYLDDFASARYNYFKTDITMSQSAGIKLSVHAPGTGSKIQMAEKIGPGIETLVHISQTKHSRLPAPYGTCSEQMNLSSVEIKEGDTVYTKDTCYGFCMQQVFMDSCRCVETEHPFYAVDIGQKEQCFNYGMFNPDIISAIQIGISVFDFINKLPKWQTNFLYAKFGSLIESAVHGGQSNLANAQCLLNLRARLSEMLADCNCPAPCIEYTYDVTTIGSPWPHHSYQLAFYNKYIAPHPEIYGNKFDVYARIQTDVANVSNAEIIKRLYDEKLIRKNFIRVNVLFDSYASIEIVTSAVMTVDQLTSSVGGALGLWIGITTIFVMEMIDLLYKLLKIIFT